MSKETDETFFKTKLIFKVNQNGVSITVSFTAKKVINLSLQPGETITLPDAILIIGEKNDA